MLDVYLRQEHFRFRNDDGDEAGASWSDNLDTNKSALLDPAGALDTRKCRVRIAIYEVNGEVARKSTFTVIQRVNGGAWSTPGQADVPLFFFDSAFITGTPSTTQQISSGGYTPGELYDSGSALSELEIAGTTSIEFEMCMALDDTQLDVSYTWGDFIEIGMIYADGTAMDEYLVLSGMTVKANVKVYTMSCESGAFGVDGHEAAQKKDSREPIDSGSFPVVGSDIIMRKGIPVPMESGHFGLNAVPPKNVPVFMAAGYDGFETIVEESIYAVDFLYSRVLVPESTNYGFNGGDAGLYRNYKLFPEDTNYPLSGGDIDMDYTRVIRPQSENFPYQGGEVGLLAKKQLVLEDRNYPFNGGDVGFVRGLNMPMGAGAYGFVGGDLNYSRFYAMEMESGLFTAALQNVILSYSEEGKYEIIPLGENFPYNGGDVSLLRKNLRINCESGHFPFTGGDHGYFRRKNMLCESGAFAFNGGDIQFSRRKTMNCDGASFPYAGYAASILKSKSVLTATGYLYEDAGESIRFLAGSYARRLTQPNTFSVSGGDVTFGKVLRMTMESGSYDAVLYPIITTVHYKLNADGGSYPFVGGDISLFRNAVGSFGSGEFVVTGGDLGMRLDYKMNLEGGHYLFRGYPINLSYSEEKLLTDRWCFPVNLGWSMYAKPNITNYHLNRMDITQGRGHTLTIYPYSSVDYSITESQRDKLNITDYKQIDMETLNGCE